MDMNLLGNEEVKKKLIADYLQSKKNGSYAGTGLGENVGLGLAGLGDAFLAKSGRKGDSLNTSLAYLNKSNDNVDADRQNKLQVIGQYLKADTDAANNLKKIEAENAFQQAEKEKDRGLQKTIADARNKAIIEAAGLRAEGSKDYQNNVIEDRKQRQRGELISKFNTEIPIKKSQQSIDAANQIRALVESNNPIAAASIPTYAARLAGEVGALSEADKAPFGGSRAILERVNQALTQGATGKTTPENRKFMLDLTKIIEQRAKSNINNLAKSRAKQYGTLGYYGGEEDILKTLVPDYQEESMQVEDKFTPGKKYKMKDGSIATYIGNGEFE